MKEINSQSSIVNNTQVQKTKKKHKALKAAAFIGTAALVGGAVYFHKNPGKLEVFANILNEKVFAPLKQKDVPVQEKMRTVINNVVSTVGPKVKQGVEQATTLVNDVKTSPEFKEFGQKAGELIKKGAFVIGSLIGSVATGTAVATSKDDSKDVKEEAAEDLTPVDEAAAEETIEEEIAETEETGEEIQTGETDVVDEADVADEIAETEEPEETTETPAEEANEPEVSSAPKFVVKTSNGEDFVGDIKVTGMTGVDGKPLQGSLNVDLPGGKHVVLTYKDGSLAQSMIYNEEGDVPSTIKNYTDGKINLVYNGLRTQEGKKGYIADETSTLRDSSVTKKVIVKDGKTIEQHYKKNVDEEGKVQGKPIHMFSVQPELLADGTKKRSFSIPTEDGDRLIRVSENLNGNKKITLMSIEQEPLAVIASEQDKAPSKYILNVDGGEFDGVISLDNGKVKEVENLTFEAIEVEPESGETFITFTSDTLEGARIKVVTDKDENITKIATYSAKGSDTPDCETIFENGMPLKDFFFDETGKVVFSSKYASKK